MCRELHKKKKRATIMYFTGRTWQLKNSIYYSPEAQNDLDIVTMEPLANAGGFLLLRTNLDRSLEGGIPCWDGFHYYSKGNGQR